MSHTKYVTSYVMRDITRYLSSHLIRNITSNITIAVGLPLAFQMYMLNITELLHKFLIYMTEASSTCDMIFIDVSFFSGQFTLYDT